MQSSDATRKTLVFRWSPIVVPATTDSTSWLAIATSCQECKPDQLEELGKIGDVVPSNKLPSQVIADAFKQRKEIPSEAELSDLTAKVFLHPDEVQVLLKHVQSASENRKERERKAARKMRKAC